MLLTLLLILEILVSAALTAVILLQRSEGGALGMGGGPSGFMTARGAGDLLTRTTSILAGAFFLLALIMTLLSARGHSGGSVTDRLKVQSVDPAALSQSLRKMAAPTGQPAPGAPATGAAPTGPTAPISAPVTTPAVQPQSTPAVRPASPAPNTGVRSGASRVLGVQTAPQASPTVAPRPPARRPATTAPTSAAPPSSAPAPAAAAPASTPTAPPSSSGSAAPTAAPSSPPQTGATPQ